MTDEQIEIIQLIKNILSSKDEKEKNELWNKYKNITEKEKFEEELILLVENQRKQIGHLPCFETLCQEKKILKDIPTEILSNNVIRDNLDKLSFSANLKEKSRILMAISKEIQKDRCISISNEKKINELLSNNTFINYTDPFKSIKEMYDNKSLASGFSTGIDMLDYKCGMLRKGTVNTILGFTGSGKTMWATNIAYLAAKQNYNVAYISLEISEEHEIYNIISRYSFELKNSKKIEHRKLKNRTLEEDDEKYVFDTLVPDLEDTIAKHLKIVGENNFKSYSPKSFTSILKTVDDLFLKETGKGIDMVVVDHIQLLKHRTDNKVAKDGRELINSFVSYFRKQSLNFLNTERQVCFLLLSQANRTSWEEADSGKRVLETGSDGKSHYKKVDIGTYSLTGLAEANELERSSSIVLSIYTDELLIQEQDALVMILKARNGESMESPIKTVINAKYYFFGDDKRFQTNENANLNTILNITDDTNKLELESFSNLSLEDIEKMF